MAALTVEGIGELLTMVPRGEDPLGIVRDAVVVIDGGAVTFAGAKRDAPNVAGERIDAGGALVTPGLIEPHAHPIFAGTRAAEFELRARGATYGEIQAVGGGILATVRATRAASDDELIESTLARLGRLAAHGVTACEAKTGYALDVDGELRLLRLLAEVKRRAAAWIDLSPTLLAHVPPPDQERAAFVRRFCEQAIPWAPGLGAEAIDVYCDEGAFTLDETRAILEAGAQAGLALRVHAEQFTRTGAAELAASLGARSVEHLEQLTASAPAALARAGTVCNLLPGAALTLKLPWPDARRLLDAGCAVALGTDLNPGSSLTESLPLMMSLACMQMGMRSAEAWRAVTVHAARAIGRADAGRLAPGARGDLVIWQCGDHREVPQHFGVNLVDQVIVGGRLAARDY